MMLSRGHYGNQPFYGATWKRSHFAHVLAAVRILYTARDPLLYTAD